MIMTMTLAGNAAKIEALSPAIRDKYEWELECIKLVVEAAPLNGSTVEAIGEGRTEASGEGPLVQGSLGERAKHETTSTKQPGGEDLDDSEEYAVLCVLDTLFEPPAPRPATDESGKGGGKEGAALGLDEAGVLSDFYTSSV